jgi:hypothetical protein
VARGILSAGGSLQSFASPAFAGFAVIAGPRRALLSHLLGRSVVRSRCTVQPVPVQLVYHVPRPPTITSIWSSITLTPNIGHAVPNPARLIRFSPLNLTVRHFVHHFCRYFPHGSQGGRPAGQPYRAQVGPTTKKSPAHGGAGGGLSNDWRGSAYRVTGSRERLRCLSRWFLRSLPLCGSRQASHQPTPCEWRSHPSRWRRRSPW